MSVRGEPTVTVLRIVSCCITVYDSSLGDYGHHLLEEACAMLAVSAVLPDTMPDHPSLILIHGSANSAAVWGFWQQALAEQGWPSYAMDLRGHGQSGPRA